jgi:hypothetical protein
MRFGAGYAYDAPAHRQQIEHHPCLFLFSIFFPYDLFRFMTANDGKDNLSLVQQKLDT